MRETKHWTTTPLGAVAAGLAAGLAGTAAMTGYQTLVSKARKAGKDGGSGGEGSGEQQQQQQQQSPWDEAPAPAQVGRRFIEGVFHRELPPPDKVGLVTNLVHWTYGTLWGSVYGLVQGTAPARPVPSGLSFGTAVWGMGYVLLPAMKIYKPIWEYPPKTLAVDLSYHLVYGLGVAGAHRALAKG